jgi:hypothetical protein
MSAREAAPRETKGPVLSPERGEDLLLHEWGAGGMDVSAYPVAWMARTPMGT